MDIPRRPGDRSTTRRSSAKAAERGARLGQPGVQNSAPPPRQQKPGTTLRSPAWASTLNDDKGEIGNPADVSWSLDSTY
ncbi:hypothetical protein ACRAWD_28550 [Caulobacter segnis]